nr:YdiU family protein [Polymorphobacter multimanifer]
MENSYRRLPPVLFEERAPVPVKAPTLLLWNDAVAARLGLGEVAVDVLAGNALPPGSEPIAQAYAGHQFGHPNMLGDGRQVLLGEQIAPDGVRFDMALKGSGRTRYSRSGDGRAALGPMLREYVISEAMRALGVPTTLSLAVVGTGEAVLREDIGPGGILVRVAASHVRVGTFQFAAAQEDPAVLVALADHIMARHFPALAAGDYVGLVREVVARQAWLIAEWMRVGFVHGVMNTDNMALSGETIDYGPCAFLEAYGRDIVFSSIDHGGRYAFGAQPSIALWNLTRFAETLLALPGVAIDDLKAVLEGFPAVFEGHWLAAMRGKLGLTGADDGDAALVAEVLDWLETSAQDHTNFFRALADGLAADADVDAPWAARWRARTGPESVDLIRRTAPAVIPRNHLVDAALRAGEGGDLEPMRALLDALALPYAEKPENAGFRMPASPEQAITRTFCGT